MKKSITVHSFKMLEWCLRTDLQIGKGKKDFNKARDLLKKWAHFQLNWAFVDPDTPITQHHPYAVLTRVRCAYDVG